MPRWYAGFRCHGRADAIVDVVERVVTRQGLADTVPLLRVERGAERRREFCLFLAIESPERGQLPDELEPLLSLPMLSARYDQPFSLDEIGTMAGPDLTVYDHALRIPFVAPAPFAEEDPFGADVDGSATPTPTLDPAQTVLHDRLLVWLSATGSGSWEGYLGATRALGLDAAAGSSRRLLRRLRLLGHVEASADGARWSVAPTVIVRTGHPIGSGRFFLAGRRDGMLLDIARRVAEVRVVDQPAGGGPPIVEVRPDNPKQALQELKALTNDQLRYGGIAAEWLAAHVPTIDGWMESLQQLRGLVPSLHELRRYDGAGFAPVSFAERSGMYEIWPLRGGGGSPRPKYTAFYHAPSRRWFRGDWYGLRFLALLAAKARCPAHYDARSGVLAVHDGWRMPELYERVLVLASGVLPTHRPPWFVYRAIGPRVARTLASKLEMHMEGLPEDA